MSKTVLIIEDEKPLAEALRDELTNKGYEVSIASDGLVGLERALNEHPNILLVDILMPQLNGLDMLDQIRTDAWGKSVPVIILTNQSEDEDVLAGLQRLAQAYFIKSDTSLETIAKSIVDLIGQPNA